MGNESAYERRRREASEVAAQFDYPEGDFFAPDAKSAPEYREYGITSMITAINSALSSLENNAGKLSGKIAPLLAEGTPTVNEAPPPGAPIDSPMANELFGIMRRIQFLDNFITQTTHRIDL